MFCSPCCLPSKCWPVCLECLSPQYLPMPSFLSTSLPFLILSSLATLAFSLVPLRFCLLCTWFFFFVGCPANLPPHRQVLCCWLHTIQIASPLSPQRVLLFLKGALPHDSLSSHAFPSLQFVFFIASFSVWNYFMFIICFLPLETSSIFKDTDSSLPLHLSVQHWAICS